MSVPDADGLFEDVCRAVARGDVEYWRRAVADGVGARLSLVARLEGGDWRIAHWHLSVAVADDDAFPEVMAQE